MTVNRGPGVAPIAGVGTTTLEHRLQLAGQYAENAPGVPRSGVLAQATDLLVVGKLDMSYDVGPAALVISRTAGEGVYTPTLTGTTNVATSAAPGTNSRWDLIYVKQNDQAKGDADNAAVIDVQEGTAAASPTKPTADLPSGAYVLAEARIFAGTTGTSGGSNTIAQVWRHTAARGGPIRVRNVTERAEITTPGSGQQIIRLDIPGRPLEVHDGSQYFRDEAIAWSTLGAWTTPNGTISRRWNGSKWEVNFIGHLVLSTDTPFTLTTAMATIGTAVPSGWTPAPGTAYGTGAYSNNTPTYQGPIVARVDTSGVLSVAAVTGTLGVVQNCQFFIDISWTY